MSKIFLSYRRNDSEDVTGRIYDSLSSEFGKDAIFKDVDSIPLGVDFRKYLDEKVAQCQVFLAIIGKEWHIKRGSRQPSLLDNEQDFVRIEIESALKRNILLIPLLVKGAEIPSEKTLPESIKDIAFRQSLPIRPDPDFHNDIRRLMDQLKLHVSPPPIPQKASPPKWGAELLMQDDLPEILFKIRKDVNHHHRKLKIKLSREEHIVEYKDELKEGMQNMLLTLDGVELERHQINVKEMLSGYVAHLTKSGATYKFQINDGEETYPAILKVSWPFLTPSNDFRFILQVSGRIIYREGSTPDL